MVVLYFYFAVFPYPDYEIWDIGPGLPPPPPPVTHSFPNDFNNYNEVIDGSYTLWV